MDTGNSVICWHDTISYSKIFQHSIVTKLSHTQGQGKYDKGVYTTKTRSERKKVKQVLESTIWFSITDLVIMRTTDGFSDHL